MRWLRLLALLALAAALITGCGRDRAQRLGVTVVAQHPHDPGAFTQGLLLAGDGYLYESTGLVGSSSLRQVDLESGAVLRLRMVPAPYFGEGLAQVGDQLLMLTWQQQQLLLYDFHTFEPLGQLQYAGEGWGLCYDGADLYMTDGSATLFKRDAATFEVLSTVEVRLDGKPLARLNELECVQGAVYANVWLTDQIVKIEPASGRVQALIDAAPLRQGLGITDPSAVLNGIAYDPAKDLFLLTGKLWPALFEVRFEAQ